MKYLEVTESFAAAHKLDMLFKDGHKCHNLHGHTWQVVASVVEPEDVFIDFGVLKRDVRILTETLDHSYLNDVLDTPTAENLVDWFADNMQRMGYSLHQIKVWESPTSCCTGVYR